MEAYHIAKINVGHLRLSTREIVTASPDTLPFSPLTGPHGFIIPTTDLSAFEDAEHRIPGDLLLAIQAAAHMGFGMISFDDDGPRSEHLPWFEDGDFVLEKGSVLEAARGGAVTAEAFQVGMGPSGIRLEDADYVAPDGLWLTVGDVSVRVASNDHGVDVSLTPLGGEDAFTISTASATFEEAREWRDGNLDGEDASPAP